MSHHGVLTNNEVETLSALETDELNCSEILMYILKRHSLINCGCIIESVEVFQSVPEAEQSHSSNCHSNHISASGNRTHHLYYVDTIRCLMLYKNSLFNKEHKTPIKVIHFFQKGEEEEVASQTLCFFFTFEVKRRAERREREGEDPALVCDTPLACWPLYLSSHYDPSHFSCPAIKRTGRNQRWPMTFRETGAGVTWW